MVNLAAGRQMVRRSILNIVIKIHEICDEPEFRPIWSPMDRRAAFFFRLLVPPVGIVVCINYNKLRIEANIFRTVIYNRLHLFALLTGHIHGKLRCIRRWNVSTVASEHIRMGNKWNATTGSGIKPAMAKNPQKSIVETKW